MSGSAELGAVRRFWTERVAHLHTPGDAEAAQVRASAVAVLDNNGRLTSVQRSMLAGATAELERRDFPHSADLLHLARLVQRAAAQDQSNVMPRRSSSAALYGR
ncbi:hypothetical protein [Couchioplanes caeruleus]|uniref:Uncharacterized protein n=2 Tax=Couchioplanes caeruleus TaxID=56438 RepID=A0A1K0GY32_9ACTN|nr:hypothetical protein [Couchioplanes caeruleus]OJF14339.1 hypothetical protein BG844_10470 [Couchioplanes caeruleus subsp. caeruleus]ROP32889.1 hypothetical protein EDD30_5842 [Couchioplanes caeruleus]